MEHLDSQSTRKSSSLLKPITPCSNYSRGKFSLNTNSNLTHKESTKDEINNKLEGNKNYNILYLGGRIHHQIHRNQSANVAKSMVEMSN